ncbi:MAG: phage holin family protein [Neisseria sp.]|nr:phage holin family protein [Neisseria sp.]
MGVRQEINHAKTLFNHAVDLLLLRLQVLGLELDEQAGAAFQILIMALAAAVLLLVGLLCVLLGLNRLLGDTAAVWLFLLTGLACLAGIGWLACAMLALGRRQCGRMSAALRDVQDDVACLRGLAADGDAADRAGEV